ncbi:MAG TPA: glycosyltransferase family 39 protein [Candidatus Bathyarchaeia archaeon]|nr:glycosyltransferase family 39 protein [Candidatus Bathyarchaeia archaeon]
MKERIITISILIVIVASSLFFGFHRLGNFSGVDEHYWSYDRVPKFWKAVSEMNWKNTNISDKPGVPLAMISGAGLPFIGTNPKNYKQYHYEIKTPFVYQKIRDIYFYLRLPVFLFTLAMLPFFYWLIKKLLGKNVARFSVLFIGLSPILLGISLMINSDALLWILTALSTLSFFAHLKNSERKYLILAGFFLGLSVIDKYVANILFVYFFLIFVLEYIFHAHQNIPVVKYLKQSLVNYILLSATAMVTALVFFPAAWIKISTLLKATFENEVFSSTWPLFAIFIGLIAIDTYVFKARFSNLVFDFFAKYKRLIAKALAALFLFFTAFVFLHVYAHVHIFDLQKIIASPKGIGEGNILQKYAGALSADVYSLIFSVSPLVLLFVLFAAGNMFRKREMARDTITAAYILIFLFIFYLGAAVNSVITTPRYQIMVYPLIFVVAAIGISQLMEMKKIKRYLSLPAAYAASIVVLLGSLFIVNPNFLAYSSEILPKNFIVNLKGMGEGSFEAASFLNNLPDAQKLTIWSDKGAVCEAFVGKCFIGYTKNTLESGKKIDYFVVSTDRQSRTSKMSKSRQDVIDFKKAYNTDDYVFQILINHNPNDYVKVLKSSTIMLQ